MTKANQQNSTRRAVLAGMALLPAAGGSAAPAPIGPNDARLIAIYAEWVALRRAAEVIYQQDDWQPEDVAANHDARALLEQEGITLPADGLPGVIAKMRLCAHSWYDDDTGEGGNLTLPDAYQRPGLIDIQDYTFSIFADVARIGGAA